MKNFNIRLQVNLSAPARKALAKIHLKHDLPLILELFVDTMTHERYRDFAVTPRYTTDTAGNRVAMPVSKKEKTEKTYLRLPVNIIQGLRKLQRRGLEFSWMVEEALYFAYQRGI